MEKPWFKAKKYGAGWYPASIEGYMVLIIYIIFELFLAFRIDNDPQNIIGEFIFPSTAATILLILIAYKKGEKLKWRWGKKKSDE